MATAAATASRPRTDSGSTSDSEYVEDATTEMLGQFRADVDFFEAMLDLIPAKFYIRDEEAEAQHWKNSRYYRNKKGDAPKQALKENTKKAKKAKFDLSTPHTTTQKKREQAQQDAASRDVTGEQAAARGRTNSSASAGSGAAAPAPTTGGSIQDLRARLRARIEDLRKKRKADDKDGPGEAAAVQPGEKKKRRRAKRDAEKAKRANGAAAPAPRGGAFANKGTDAKVGAAGAGAGAGAGAAAAAVPVAIDYGVVKFSTSAADQPLKKKKTNTLQQLLAKAEAKQARLQELSLAERDAVSKKDKWAAMEKRLAGEKVKDDPKLLKRSLKRQEIKKKKSAKAWAARKATVERAKKDKLKRREENLKSRGKGARKGGKQRAGFEGARNQFLNKK